MRLSDAARRLLELLGDDAILIGGLCGAVHGVERFTRDVDIAARCPPETILKALRQAGLRANMRTSSDPGDLAWVIHGEIGDIPFQILPARDTGLEQTRPEIHAGLRVPGMRDFIASKCRAGGQQDMHDVAALCLLHPDLLPHARDEAERRGRLEALESWLADERMLRRYGRARKREDTLNKPED